MAEKANRDQLADTEAALLTAIREAAEEMRGHEGLRNLAEAYALVAHKPVMKAADPGVRVLS